jgi:transcriptional regulator with XRE-family HTH domain
MESLAIVFGKRVRALREARKWTQEELAKRAGLGAKHVGVLERGEKTSSFAAIEKIADVFGVKYYELFIPEERKTATIQKEITALIQDRGRIDVTNVQEFLRSMRAALRKLDKG